MDPILVEPFRPFSYHFLLIAMFKHKKLHYNIFNHHCCACFSAWRFKVRAIAMGNAKSAITIQIVLIRVAFPSSYGQLTSCVSIESKRVKTSFKSLQQELKEITISKIEFFLLVCLSFYALLAHTQGKSSPPFLPM